MSEATNALDADGVAALLRASSEAIRAGRTGDAIAALELFLKDHHNCAEALLLLGDAYAQSGSVDDARDNYILASCFSPDSAVPWVKQGVLAYNERSYEVAISALSKALELDSDAAAAHNTLGAACFRMSRFDEALLHFERALELRPDFVDAHSNLGCLLLRELEQFEAGEEHVQAALQLEPENIFALCNQVLALQRRGRMDEALSLCDELLCRDPKLHEVRVNRALNLLGRGEYRRGWADYEARKKIPADYGGQSPLWTEWDGSSLKGRTIYISAEQGLGDEIMFASCLPQLIESGARCICECSPKLQKLFQLSFPDAVIVQPGAWRDPAFTKTYAPHVQSAIGSLPRFLRDSLDDFPVHSGYLRADPERVRYWRERLATLPGKRKVGFSWRGGSRSTRRSARSISLRQWQRLLEIPDLDVVSLQYSDCQAELTEVRSLGARIVHWQDAIDDYAETAALVCALDLVVSVQTAIVHLAGALGRPAWALISAVPEWRYGREGGAMPWYPGVRLLRQDVPGEWGDVLQRVASDLAKLTS